MPKISRYLFLFVLVCCILPSELWAVGGAWTDRQVGPNMTNEGVIKFSYFNPLGNIPSEAVVTSIIWSYSFGNQRSDLVVYIGRPEWGYNDISYAGNGITYDFAGRNPNSIIYMRFFVPGTDVISPTMWGRENWVTVNWEVPSPVPTEITGPIEVELGETAGLDGTAVNATIYSWTTPPDCDISIVGANNEATVTVQGDQCGSCTVTRTACNGYNDCTTDTHNITVANPLPTPTEITGSNEIGVGKTIELDGAAANATIYRWTMSTNCDCSIIGADDETTVTIKGDRRGSCIVTRTACNDCNECTIDTHDITVASPPLTPILLLLLLTE